MNTCPCCSQPLLRHARQNRLYWFCPRCRQEMPNLSDVLLGQLDAMHSLNLLNPIAGDRLGQKKTLEQYI